MINDLLAYEEQKKAGELRRYTVQLYYYDDSSKPAYLNRSGWVAEIQNEAGLAIHRIEKCWSQRRARNKARKWVRQRALECTKVSIVEVLEGS